MTTELHFHNRKIPVSFISSDQKAIPQLINVLERKKNFSALTGPTCFSENDRIEIIGNSAVLHNTKEKNSIELPLY